ncbi:RHS domain-containing protein [Xanthomonas sp. AM6]|uniref:RHS repeat domain-containing protein n=1 Tax=Xanthomonas sp. AM6 TaxID=2982531 RepID=UPI0021D809B6|nr:RHS repeat-associated core domain-containing protein [Xanthomonas sp. AM6]UYB51262.1 RHS domain-containing protein [Xanthomonas sp. AM6]
MKRTIILTLLLSLFLVATAHAQTVVYYHTDALGTPVAVTDASGNVVERSEYEPYGSLLNRPLTDGPGYTGHVMDAATGLTYMQQRYYDSQTGRFSSVDPVTAHNNPIGAFNRYRYAESNPYRFNDPDGRQAEDEIKKQPPPVKNMDTIKVVAQRDLSSLASYSSIVTMAPVSAVAVIPEAITTAPWVSSVAGAAVMAPFLYFASPDPCGGNYCGELVGWEYKLVYMSGAYPPGFWSGDKGAAEWGRRNGVGRKEAKDKFHRGVKDHTGGARGDHDFGVNPETGEVIDQNGEPVGNLNDED